MKKLFLGAAILFLPCLSFSYDKTFDNITATNVTASSGIYSNATVSASPTAATDVTNKTYVDSVAVGLSVHQSVIAATTGTITLSGNVLVDSYTTTTGDRILVKNQSTFNNGIWVAAAGVWARATDYDANSEIAAGTFVAVTSGTQNGNSQWVQITTGAVINVTTMTFTQLSHGQTYTNGTGLNLTLNQFSLANTAVTPTSYTNTNLTVDAQGRIIAASNGSSGGGSSVNVSPHSILFSTGGTTISGNIGAQYDNTVSSITLVGNLGIGSILNISPQSSIQATATETQFFSPMLGTQYKELVFSTHTPFLAIGSQPSITMFQNGSVFEAKDNLGASNYIYAKDGIFRVAPKDGADQYFQLDDSSNTASRMHLNFEVNNSTGDIYWNGSSFTVVNAVTFSTSTTNLGRLIQIGTMSFPSLAAGVAHVVAGSSNVVTALVSLSTETTGTVPNASIDGSSVTKQGLLLAGSNITLTPGAGTLMIAASASGSGSSIYNATSTAGFPFGFTGSTATLTSQNATDVPLLINAKSPNGQTADLLRIFNPTGAGSNLFRVNPSSITLGTADTYVAGTFHLPNSGANIYFDINGTSAQNYLTGPNLGVVNPGFSFSTSTIISGPSIVQSTNNQDTLSNLIGVINAQFEVRAASQNVIGIYQISPPGIAQTAAFQTWASSNGAILSSITPLGNFSGNVIASSITVGSDSIPQRVGGNFYSMTVSSTISNSTAETNLVGVGSGTISIPAGFWQVGRQVKIKASGIYGSTTTTPGNLSLKLNFGPTTVLSTTTFSLTTSQTNQVWMFGVTVTCRATGASGSLIGNTALGLNDTSSGFRAFPMVNTSAQTLDLTIARDPRILVTFSSADALNTFTMTNFSASTE